MEKAAAGDRGGFVALWKSATVRGDELSVPFPSVIPHQKQLLHACASLDFPDGARQVIARINPKRLEADHQLQLLVAQAQRQ